MPPKNAATISMTTSNARKLNWNRRGIIGATRTESRGQWQPQCRPATRAGQTLRPAAFILLGCKPALVTAQVAETTLSFAHLSRMAGRGKIPTALDTELFHAPGDRIRGMAKKPRKRKCVRDTAEKRLCAFLIANPGIENDPRFYTILHRAGINVSAERTVQIKWEMDRLTSRRKK